MRAENKSETEYIQTHDVHNIPMINIPRVTKSTSWADGLGAGSGPGSGMLPLAA